MDSTSGLKRKLANIKKEESEYSLDVHGIMHVIGTLRIRENN